MANDLKEKIVESVVVESKKPEKTQVKQRNK